jgi:hypothetical protein
MTDYRMTCRHCGARFVEMRDLLFHRCPVQRFCDQQNPRRSHAKRTVKRKVTNPTGRPIAPEARGM